MTHQLTHSSYLLTSCTQPMQVPDRYVAKFDFIDDKTRQYYHAMVKYLDDVVCQASNNSTQEAWYVGQLALSHYQ